MIIEVNPNFLKYTSNLLSIIKDFRTSGVVFGNGKRNTIKLFELENQTINIKSFKVPHLFNRIVYKYFRESKAKRSYEYATTLLEKGIGTPQPIAYFENTNWLGLKDSYYVSEHLVTELTFRELITIPDYPDHENILRQFTRFTFDLHEKGIEFLDHSPGNTLINKGEEGQYHFYLVDLNRMNFHKSMNFEQRMRNFSHLAANNEMIVIMSEEYAKYYSKHSENQIFEEMSKKAIAFQNKYSRKKRIKNKIKFWKKKN